ncbi:MAG: hypothetical protein KatS3mg027_1984 [Bacteroidia bacterium]|nr:MAG: hypothetical protein KatS3mg027_1984 [Bacteroidia bacterium]
MLAACEILRGLGWKLKTNKIQYAIKNTPKITGFMGRWEILKISPFIIADIAHNKQGLQNTLSNLKNYSYHTLRVVFGVVKDKEIENIIPLLTPKKPFITLRNPNVPRALPVDELETVFKKIFTKLQKVFKCFR